MTPEPGPDAGSEAGPGVAVDFDPDALRARYREERDKRLRPDGNAQYRELAGPLARFLADPAVTEPDRREPCDERVGLRPRAVGRHVAVQRAVRAAAGGDHVVRTTRRDSEAAARHARVQVRRE